MGSTGAMGQAAPGLPGGLEGDQVGPDLAAVVTFLETDMADNAVRVGIDPALAPEVGPLGVVSEQTFEQSAAAVAELLKDHIEVAFKVADGRGIALAANFQGGEAMSDCTSGFTARRARRGGYDYGIITAGHCGGDYPTNTAPVSMSGVSLPFVFGWLSATADAQFHRIPTPSSGSHNVADDYLCRNPASYPNPYCDVTRTAARAEMPGDYVCHTGKNSGISCGTVTSIDYARTRSSRPCRDSAGEKTACQPVFVRMHGQFLRGCRGDSGGAVYRGGAAYGISASVNDRSNCTSGGKWVTFSAIREVEAFLRVNVLTEPVTLSAP